MQIFQETLILLTFTLVPLINSSVSDRGRLAGPDVGLGFLVDIFVVQTQKTVAKKNL